MSEDYIPLVTYDLKLAFCQATNQLCTDVQRIIWKQVITTEPECPSAPKKILRPATKHLLKSTNDKKNT